MSDFLKCDCPHCGQSIEYPAEGTGETVPCPTCEKPITLPPTKLTPSSEKEKSISKWSNLFRERNRSQEVMIPSPTREKPVKLPPEHPSTEFGSNEIQATPDTRAPITTQAPKAKKTVRTNLSKLTEETIRARTQKGDTPLHRAAKTGRISEIPRHLLTTELFMARNNSFARETPLHLAAQYGHLDKVPKEFLTRETLTASTEYERKESKTGPTPPRTETPLHYAARYGHADQIPKEFLTPEFLSIEASGYRLTVLHQLAYANMLDLVPEIYANSEMWNLKNSSGQTPRDVVETNIKQEAYAARVRSEPATEKQKEKLRYFGYAFDESISKGQASDAIDKCVRDNPEKNRAYYNRPATKEQLAKVREFNEHPDCGPDEPFYDFENEGPLTYGKAKDLIQEWGWLQREKRNEDMEKEMKKFSSPPSKAQRALLKESGIKLDSSAKITEGDLDDVLSLEAMPPRQEDLNLFKQHGITSFTGDGFAAYALGDLIRCFWGSAQDHNRSNVNYVAACQAALHDPAYFKPTLSRDWEGFVAFTWSKSKIKEWLRS